MPTKDEAGAELVSGGVTAGQVIAGVAIAAGAIGAAYLLLSMNAQRIDQAFRYNMLADWVRPAPLE